MTFYLVDETWNVRIPNADFVIKSCTEQQNHSLVKGQTQNPSVVFLVNPFFLGVDCVPKNEFTVHPA